MHLITISIFYCPEKPDSGQHLPSISRLSCALLKSLVLVVVLGGNSLDGIDLQVDHSLELGLLVFLVEGHWTLVVD